LTIFGGCKPTFVKPHGDIWRDGADLGLPPPRQILYYGQIYAKNSIFWRFWWT